jgi:hypothetical protein
MTITGIIVLLIYILLIVSPIILGEMSKNKKARRARKWQDDNWVVGHIKKTHPNGIKSNVPTYVIRRVIQNEALDVKLLNEEKRKVIIDMLLNGR